MRAQTSAKNGTMRMATKHDTDTGTLTRLTEGVALLPASGNSPMVGLPECKVVPTVCLSTDADLRNKEICEIKMK